MKQRIVGFFWPYGILLLVFTVISLVLQLHNISHYNVYPDSYQSVTVAQNLKKYHQLVAPMGSGGLVYPDFFGWTRPLYPFLIIFVSWFGASLLTAAHIVAVAAGLFAVVAIFGFVSAILRSKKAGLSAALLLTLSFSRAVWGGFIFTETLGILTLTLALWSLWFNKNIKDEWFANQDIFTGILFALAVLTRYEYIVLLIPAAFLAAKNFSIKRTTSIIITNLTIVFLILAPLHPFTGGFSWAWSQLNNFVYILGAGFALASAGFAVIRKYKNKTPLIELWIARFVMFLLIISAILLILDRSLYPALRLFAQDDFVLCLTALFGLFTLLNGNRDNKRLGLILCTGILILMAVYYRVNSDMERYITHLSPLFLIAAAYGIQKFIKFKPRIVVLIFAALFLSWQSIKTWNGLNRVDDSIWYKPGYEEISAKKLNSKIADTNMLITSTPEPYYLFTNNPTQSIADYPPYIYADLPKDGLVTIVEDEDMRKIFPNFTSFVQKNLSSYKVNEYWVGEPIRYTTYIALEQKPVIVYQINALKLKNLLDNTQLKR